MLKDLLDKELKVKSSICMYLLLGVWVLTGCRAISPVITPAISKATIDNTPAPILTPMPITSLVTPSAISTPSPEATPKLKPTVEINPSSTTWAGAGLAEQGKLWVCFDYSHRCRVIDLVTSSVDIVNIPEECLFGLIPGRSATICQNLSTEPASYLLNLETQETETLPLPKAEYYSWSPNGQFLLYRQLNDERDTYTLLSYEIATQITQTLAVEIALDSWYSLPEPLLSADGRYIAGIGSNSIEIVSSQPKSQVYNPNNLFLSWDIAWSPTTPLLVYGAADFPQQYGPPLSNHLFIVEAARAQVELLTKAESLYDYGFGFIANQTPQFPWSSDGTKVVVVGTDYDNRDRLCILTIDTSQELCHNPHPIYPQHSIWSPVWSPQGKQIAFWRTGHRGTGDFEGRQDLVVFTLADQSLVVLLEDVEWELSDSQMYWR